MLLPSSPRRRLVVAVIPALAMLLVTVLGTVAALVRDGDDTGGADRRDVPGSRVVPVLLVHGYGGDPTNVDVIAERLRADGRQTVAVSLPLRGVVAIDQSVAWLAGVVEETGAEQVDLVGYSLGGVVVRAYAAQQAEAGDDAVDVRHVVTVAAPHHGTALAATALAFDPTRCTLACAELLPDSTFLRGLNDGDETPGDAQWLALRTDEDRTVTPVDSASLDGARNISLQEVCPDSRVGHGSINRDPLPVGLLALFLADALPEVLGPADCGRMRAAGLVTAPV